MVAALFNNYQKYIYKIYLRWKFFTFTLFKIKSNELDFKNIYIKVLITEVKSKIYTLFMFEAM